MPKPIIIASLGYKRPGEVKKLRNLCKYLQYRDGSVRREAFMRADPGTELRYPDGLSDYARPEHRDVKWVDRGMGETYHQIANRAYDWQGRRTLARTWVISPDPELMQHIPEGKRFEVVRNVTEATVERWYSDNGWGQAEYSYVVHDKHRTANGEQMAHSHIITPGTITIDEAGSLGRIDHIVRRAHVRDLHRTSAQVFEEELGRVLGRDRAQELIAERDARIERERDPLRARRDKMARLQKLADVMQLLQAEKAARQAKKSKRRRKRRSRQRMAELRMYVRYVAEERQKRREADTRRMAAARQQSQDSELDAERLIHHARVQRIKARGRRIPTHAELREREEMERRELAAYYTQLLVRQGLIELDPDDQPREPSHEIGR
jgi:hypothetical protein